MFSPSPCMGDSPGLHFCIGLFHLRFFELRQLPIVVASIHFVDGVSTSCQNLHHSNHSLHVQGGDNYCQTLSPGAGHSGTSITFLHIKFIIYIAIKVSSVWLRNNRHHGCSTCGRGNGLNFDFGVTPEVSRRNEGILFFISGRHGQESTFLSFYSVEGIVDIFNDTRQIGGSCIHEFTRRSFPVHKLISPNQSFNAATRMCANAPGLGVV